jgi:hypothetical protein
LWLSRIPVDGTYLGNLLAPLVVMAAGLGLLYAGVQTAANAGVPEDQAGLAASLITTSFQLGSGFQRGPARAGLGRRASGCSRGVVIGSRAIVVARTMGARCFRNK